jgi:hypothetical protein
LCCSAPATHDAAPGAISGRTTVTRAAGRLHASARVEMTTHAIARAGLRGDAVM